MKLRLLKISFISLGIAAGIFLIMRLFFGPMLSTGLSIIILIILEAALLVITSKNSSTVMADKAMPCPHCGSVIEAAFINGVLAMSLKCPVCGKIIFP